MKLREYDVDAPEEPKTVRAQFREEVRCMAAFFGRELPSFEAGDAWKVLVECVKEPPRRPVINLLGVLTIQQQFDVASYFALGAEGKKAAVLDVLLAGVLDLARERIWPALDFVATADRVRASGYRNEWQMGRAKWAPDRRRSAHLWCRHELDSFEAWLVVEERGGGEVVRQRIVLDRPSEFSFARKLGSVVWTDSQRVVLVSRDRVEIGHVAVPEPRKAETGRGRRGAGGSVPSA